MYIPGANVAAVIVNALTRFVAGDGLMTRLGMTLVRAEVTTLELETTLRGAPSLRSLS